MKKIAILVGLLMLILILVVAIIGGKSEELPIVESGDSGDIVKDDFDKWLEEFDTKEYFENYSGEIKEIDSEMNDILVSYMGYVITKDNSEYADYEYGFIELDETGIPYMYDGHKFYHYENGTVKEIKGYLSEREDRTSKYYIKNKPFILDVFNYMGLQSYTIYKLENGNFNKIYSSEEYIVNKEDLGDIDTSNYKVLEGIYEKEVNFLINQHLETTDYKTECVLYMGLADNVSTAIGKYTEELRENF